MRRYGDAEMVFLERKLRKPGLLAKRRTIVALDGLPYLDGDRTDPGWDGDWFHRRLLLRREKPVCQISYARIARATSTLDGPARLTLDDDVRVTTAREPRFASEAGPPVLGRRMILELKYGQHLPAIFKRLVEEFKLDSRPASKYRLGMTTLGGVAFPLTLAEAPGTGRTPRMSEALESFLTFNCGGCWSSSCAWSSPWVSATRSASSTAAAGR